MSDFLNDWWRTRSLREQRLLLAMFGLLAIVLAWLLIIRPLGDALSQARERHGRAVLAVAEARAQAQAITGLNRSAPVDQGVPVDTLISRSATEAGFPVTGIQRENSGAATVTIQSVRPQAFFGWVNQMESRNGLIVERLSATTNSDQTLAVTITMRRRSG
jgi:general secretion pathway protein M